MICKAGSGIGHKLPQHFIVIYVWSISELLEVIRQVLIRKMSAAENCRNEKSSSKIVPIIRNTEDSESLSN